MLTRLMIRNFKRFDEIQIELGQTVLFVGPNNSGKTSALQALALWGIAVETHQDLNQSVLNRLNLVALPVPTTRLLWRNLHTKNSDDVEIEIRVEGIHDGHIWQQRVGLQYANDESIVLSTFESNSETPEQQVAFLPPMSGLASVEPRLERGRINVLIGEGRTAEVLRNLCLLVYEAGEHWATLVQQIQRQFNVELLPPQYLAGRGEIRMTYRESSGVELDLSASGRGMLQILMLLTYLYSNPNTVLLLDEPDAHLEILRQREIYKLLTDVARAQGSQIIIASHSEVLLNDAAQKDIVIAFVGKPHRIDNRRSSQIKQVLKSLNYLGYDQYYQAEQTGWVLYLEGSTDLDILRAFASKLGHRAAQALASPFVSYVGGNDAANIRNHFYGLREAYPNLAGLAIFDRLEKGFKPEALQIIMWRKREIENYLCFPETLLAYARHEVQDDDRAQQHETIMQTAIEEITNALTTLDKPSPWSDDIKASDEFLKPLFSKYYDLLGLPNLMRKSNFHVLANFVPIEKIDAEITEKLDKIAAIAESAKTL